MKHFAKDQTVFFAGFHHLPLFLSLRFTPQWLQFAQVIKNVIAWYYFFLFYLRVGLSSVAEYLEHPYSKVLVQDYLQIKNVFFCF